MVEGYFDKRNAKNIEKTREICAELPEFITEYIVGIQLRTAPLTRLSYVSDIKIFFEYLLKYKIKGKTALYEITMSDVAQLKAYDIELFLDYLSSYKANGKHYKCGDAAKERKLASIRSLFKYLYKRDYIPANITEKVDAPKIHDKPIRFLETNEIARLLDIAETGESLTKRQRGYQHKTRARDVAILSLFLGTGIRISECIGLDKDDLDIEMGAISVTRKGGTQTVLYFSEEVGKALKNYLDWLDIQREDNTEFYQKISDKNALFLSLQGKRITVRAVQKLVEKYCSIVSPLKRITPHKLRSTFGTTLYRETKDIYVVAEVLGHKDVNTTKKHYAAISDEIKRNAAHSIKLREPKDD